MKRVHVLVEGQTEEAFVQRVLKPHLAVLGVHMAPIIVLTKRLASGQKLKGGLASYAQVRKDLVRLLGDSDAAAVTTMFDYYRLPTDFPGLATLPRGATVWERAHLLEDAVHADLDDARLRPYLSVHEFEALLLTDPMEIEQAIAARGLGHALAAALAGVESPEVIDDGEASHPAARIVRLAPSYQKALHGPIIAERIGLEALRARCPHFASWVDGLEALAR